MKALFIELPAFERHRRDYLDDESYRLFQNELLQNPEKGVLIPGMKGLRKIRVANPERGKGKRGGARVIYYWFMDCAHFVLFTIYGKEMQDDLSSEQRRIFVQSLEKLMGEEL